MDIWSAMIGAASAILGSVVSQLITWNLQKKTEEKKRTWYLEDLLRDKENQILEKRINEIEKLARALSSNFFEKRLAFELYISNSENSDKTPEFVSNIVKNTSELQTEFYAITPMIISLDAKNDKFKSNWIKATEIDNKLVQIIVNEPAYPKTNEYDPKNTIQIVTKLNSAFNETMADFYNELDSLQINTIEDFIRYSTL